MAQKQAAIPRQQYASLLDTLLCCTEGKDSALSESNDLRQCESSPSETCQQPYSSIPKSHSTGDLSKLAVVRGSSRAESVILPHLRFDHKRKRDTPVLDEFFDMFLADTARHSFEHFHQQNGDEDVVITAWRSAGDHRMRRDVSFLTMISPNSSDINSPKADGTTIPMKVFAVQTLSKEKTSLVMKCVFTFEMATPTSPPSSIKDVGKKALSHFLMFNVVKGCSVNVSVILSECNVSRRDIVGQEASRSACRDAPASIVEDEDEEPNLFWGLLNHSFLLPSCWSNCGAKADEPMSSLETISKDKENEGASEVGAALLSAIRAKNENSVFVGSSSSRRQFDGLQVANSRLSEPDDVLRSSSCVSQTSLKSKNSSFDLDSSTTMRRMILERGRAFISSGDEVRSNGCSQKPPSPTSLSMRIQMRLGDSSSSNPQAPPSANSSSSSLSRSKGSGSITGHIDDKIRRGLKKRVAKQWIAWAESFCMRYWQDEEAEQARRKALGIPQPRTNKRNRSNTRPTVRKIVKTATRTVSPLGTPTRREDEGWTPLRSGRKYERWMAVDCGVEVDFSTKKQSMGRRRSPMSLRTSSRRRSVSR